jgi:hypothetical protein
MKATLSLIWFATLIPFRQLTYATNPQLSAGGEQNLTILVHDYAGLSDSAVHELETSAGVLLSRSGIRAEWVWCNAGRRDARSTLCDADLETGRIVFRILNRYPGNFKRTGDVLGAAEIEGSYASLYAAEIRQNADRGGLSYGCLLAYAAVHEIGHLLLGKEHSRTGVMRAEWGKAEYREMAQRGLGFSEPERQALRQALTPGERRVADLK